MSMIASIVFINFAVSVVGLVILGHLYCLRTCLFDLPLPPHSLDPSYPPATRGESYIFLGNILNNLEALHNNVSNKIAGVFINETKGVI